MTQLRRRMTEDLILHNLSPKTIRLYINWVADFAKHFHASPEHLGPEHIRSYLLHLLQERRVSWNVYRQARLALRFLYRVTLGREWVVEKVACPKAPKKLPVVLSRDEMARFLDALGNLKRRALLMTAYAGGLRLSEVAHLRVEDIDSPRMVIHVRQGKGQKDRDVMLSPRLLTVLREYWKACRPRTFHVVFTLPNTLGPVARANPRVMYDLLMRAAAKTLLEVAANPKHLGAEVGVLAVLHTWGQNLTLHPHVHYVVTGGGLAPDASRWVAGRNDFFLPVRVLSRVFRGKFLCGLRAAFRRGRLRFPGPLAAVVRPGRFHRLLDQTVRSEWVVYAKPPTKGPATVLKYLARYTHRAAISNRRLVSLTAGQVTFRWKDYAQGSRRGTMTLKAVEFVRRFLMHVLPAGFVRVRHYGLLANRRRQHKLARCRELLGMAAPQQPDTAPTDPDVIPPLVQEAPVTPTRACPRCGAGRMIMVAEFPPLTLPEGNTVGLELFRILDSS
jgi:hypothetical protein